MEAQIKVALLYVLFAVGLGSMNGIIDLDPIFALLIALFVFYLVYRLIPIVFDLEDSSFDTSAWNVIKKGAIPYWFLWLVSWTLLYSLTIPY